MSGQLKRPPTKPSPNVTVRLDRKPTASAASAPKLPRGK